MNTDSSLSLNDSSTPQIRRFSNILTFLNAYVKYRQNEDNDFTYESWSKELGFSSSSFMYLICKGQRAFTVETAERIIPFLGLNPEEQKHILLLANYSQARTTEVKSALFDKILENLEIPEQRLIAQQYKELITSNTMLLVRAILAYDDSSGTEEEILSLLDIEPTQLKSDLSSLEKMGLIQKVQLESADQTIWKSSSKAIKVPEGSMDDVLDLFYHANLSEALNMIQQQRLYKKFRCLTMAISSDEYEVLENEIEQFVNKLKNKYFVNHLDGKHLLKFNIQAYQISKIKIK